MKVIKTCSCGKELTKDDVIYIGMQSDILPLYLCNFCKTTLVIKKENQKYNVEKLHIKK